LRTPPTSGFAGLIPPAEFLPALPPEGPNFPDLIAVVYRFGTRAEAIVLTALDG
jgi:hypothetical protein